MSILDTRKKGKIGAEAAALAIKNPGLVRRGAKASRPVAKLAFRIAKPLAARRARRQARSLADTARVVAESLLTYAAAAGYAADGLERPKPKRSAPRVAAGIAIGAGAVYLLSPDGGAEHRRKLMQLVA